MKPAVIGLQAKQIGNHPHRRHHRLRPPGKCSYRPDLITCEAVIGCEGGGLDHREFQSRSGSPGFFYSQVLSSGSC